jgi:hypothetical protein
VKLLANCAAAAAAAGVDLNELQMSYAAKKEEMARKGVAKWKQDMVGEELFTSLSNACAWQVVHYTPQLYLVNRG